MTEKKFNVRPFRPLKAIHAPVETNASQEKETRKKPSAATGPSSFRQMIISAAGLADLNLCLDAGDIHSFPSSTSQTWLDTSGNGNDYFRGLDSGASTNDPTFNGVVGARSPSEYFSFDGGDYFEETADQTFADAWHRPGSSPFTIIAVIERSGNIAQYIFNTLSTRSQGFNQFTSGVQFNTGASSSTRLSLFVSNSQFISPDLFGSTCTANSTINLTNGEPVFCAVTFTPSGASSPTFFRVNNSSETVSASGNTNSLLNQNIIIPYGIGIYRSLSVSLNANGTRIYCLACFSRVLSSNEIDSIYIKLKKRFTNMP